MAYRNNIDLESVESRRVLAKMVLRLFQHWRIGVTDQLALLGLDENHQEALSRYTRGEVLPSRDLQDREAWLLSIHRSLQFLYSENEDLWYSWVSRRNAVFDNLTPLTVMKAEGLAGISRVGRHLEARLGE